MAENLPSVSGPHNVKMYNILDGTFINPCPAEHGYLPLQNSVDPYQLASEEAN